jgi:tetratricopeptide (TPR) repeat protein
VTDNAAVTAMIERVGRELGRIDILVNNAGTSIRKPTHQLELEEWHTVMNTNLTSAFLCSKAAYPALKASGRGKVINIGSMMSIFAGSYAPAYAGLAACYYLQSNIYYSPTEMMPKAKNAALKALELDDTLGEAYAMLGLVGALYEFNREAAEKAFKRALELKPSDMEAHLWYGVHLAYIGRFDASLQARNALAAAASPASDCTSRRTAETRGRGRSARPSSTSWRDSRARSTGGGRPCPRI